MKSEFTLIESLKNIIPSSSLIKCGIGDDAAVLPFSSKEDLLFTTDVIVDGVDFHLSQLSPEWIGRKALAVNLSDIAAMGGKPDSFVVSLGIPPSMSEAWIKRFYGGMLTLAKKYGAVCAGGDISKAKQFFASIALTGKVAKDRAALRRGARPGDWIAVTGTLGGSIFGHHYKFEPRIAEGLFLNQKFRPTSMMDISDGLWQDLEHILSASSAGAELEMDSIPVSGAGKTLAHALTDGEDFELLFTVKPAMRDELESVWKKKFPNVRLSWIGRIRKKRGIQWMKKGSRISAPKISKKGFQHF